VSSMKKIFISQPMGGKRNEEILQERKELVAQAAAALGEDEIQVLDSFFTDFAEETPPLVYLGRSLEVLAHADAAIFASDWETARGCRIEHDAAEAYGVPIVDWKG